MTINAEAFPHLIYRFVLTYSNWQTGSICYSERFESLSEGLRNALWRLGGVTSEHRTDPMSAAVNNLKDAKEFTRAYDLWRHYRINGQKIQAGWANETAMSNSATTGSRSVRSSVDEARQPRLFAVTAYQLFLDKSVYGVECRPEGTLSGRGGTAAAAAGAAARFGTSRTGSRQSREPGIGGVGTCTRCIVA